MAARQGVRAKLKFARLHVPNRLFVRHCASIRYANARLPSCKRPSIALQNVLFYTLKGHLLQRKRWPLA